MDLSKIPFSYPGSYLSFHYYDEDYMNQPDVGNFPVPKPEFSGLTLRTLHYSVSTSFVCNFSSNEEFDIDFQPTQLVLKSKDHKASICFADETTFVVEGDLPLTIDFFRKNPLFQFAYPIDDNTYMLSCFKNNSRYLYHIQKGKNDIDQNFDGQQSDRLIVHISDSYLFSIKEIYEDFDNEIVDYDYNEVLKKREKMFNDFYHSVYPKEGKYQLVAKEAAYVDESCYVNSYGQLKTRAMLMSKNFMNKLWSWDHCFNAMALCPNLKEESYQQFMVPFFHQGKSGALPDSICDGEFIWGFCKPPIHGLTLRYLLERMSFSNNQLETIYECLSKNMNWWYKNHYCKERGLLYYTHGNDSGWDNGSAFKGVPPFIEPDLQSFAIIEMEMLHKIGKILNKDDCDAWKQGAENLKINMLNFCFDDNGKPLSREMVSGKVIDTKSLLPYLSIILSDQLPEHIVNKMVKDLKENFLTEWGLSTENINSDLYDEDGYWLGPIWAPSSFIVIEGLKLCKEEQFAKEISERYLRLVSENGFYENFNATTGKGLRDSAYSWTSSVFLILANEYQ